MLIIERTTENQRQKIKYRKVVFGEKQHCVSNKQYKTVTSCKTIKAGRQWVFNF